MAACIWSARRITMNRRCTNSPHSIAGGRYRSSCTEACRRVSWPERAPRNRAASSHTMTKCPCQFDTDICVSVCPFVSPLALTIRRAHSRIVRKSLRQRHLPCSKEAKSAWPPLCFTEAHDGGKQHAQERRYEALGRAARHHHIAWLA